MQPHHITIDPSDMAWVPIGSTPDREGERISRINAGSAGGDTWPVRSLLLIALVEGRKPSGRTDRWETCFEERAFEQVTDKIIIAKLVDRMQYFSSQPSIKEELSTSKQNTNAVFGWSFYAV